MQMAHGLLQKRKRNYASIRASPDGGVGGKAERADVEVKEVRARPIPIPIPIPVRLYPPARLMSDRCGYLRRQCKYLFCFVLHPFLLLSG
jgi:hypothetical protein